MIINGERQLEELGKKTKSSLSKGPRNPTKKKQNGECTRQKELNIECRQRK